MSWLGNVAPHAGAWIEIYHLRPSRASHPVAPHAGAWIEILLAESMEIKMSVAPHAGAWIEMHIPGRSKIH